MPATIDHVALPSHDAEPAARWLGWILGADGVGPDGPDGDMFNVALAGCAVLVCDADVVPAHHLAFRVTPAEFAGVVDRLRGEDVPFGNDPEDVTNGEVSDPLGGVGRVYFTTSDGHLLEVTAPSPPT